MEKLEEWVGDEKWDIIQFNWGLWDLAYRHEDSKIQGKRDKVNGKVSYSPEQYKSNLESLVKQLKSLTDAKLLFVTTSYVPEGEAGRFAEDAIIYNEKARQVMGDYNIPVNDIYDYSKQVHAGFATAADNVHFTPEGYKLLAEKIVEGLKSIDKRLR
jgi:lysophospholipase L1-like esterase